MKGMKIDSTRFPSLPRSVVSKLKKELAVQGRKLPCHGMCQRLDNGQEVCRDSKGLYLVGDVRR